MRRKIAMLIAIVGGILLLISGVNGVATWEIIRNIIVYLIGEHQLIIIIFAFLIFMGALGGISVIFGGILIGKGRLTTGKILIFLGTGTGLIGLIIRIMLRSIQQGDVSINLLLDIGILGLILSVAAQKIAK